MGYLVGGVGVNRRATQPVGVPYLQGHLLSYLQECQTSLFPAKFATKVARQRVLDISKSGTQLLGTLEVGGIIPVLLVHSLGFSHFIGITESLESGWKYVTLRLQNSLRRGSSTSSRPPACHHVHHPATRYRSVSLPSSHNLLC